MFSVEYFSLLPSRVPLQDKSNLFSGFGFSEPLVSRVSFRDPTNHACSPFFCSLLFRQEPLLLPSTLLQIHKEAEKTKTEQAQPEQKVEGKTVVSIRRGIDYRTAHNGSNKCAGLAHDTEQRKEQEFLASGCDLTNHCLAVSIPWTDLP